MQQRRIKKCSGTPDPPLPVEGEGRGMLLPICKEIVGSGNKSRYRFIYRSTLPLHNSDNLQELIRYYIAIYHVILN